MATPSFKRALVGIPVALATAIALAAAASCGARTGLVDDTPSPDADESPPSIDQFVPVKDLCPDAAATLIYVIGKSNTLYSFDPGSASFAPIGTISCPDRGQPFSMAVDREGVAYVLFDSSNLYRVSTKTAECTTTPYKGTDGILFGMGFVANTGDGGDAGETLYVSVGEEHGEPLANGVLATIDTTTFALTPIEAYHPTVRLAELTGTGRGRLFAFQPLTAQTSDSYIFEIDPTTAAVIAGDSLHDLPAGAGWAFGFWGGEFYTFTTPSLTELTSVVHRLDPRTKSLVQVATAPTGDTIVGAGVSTCAPL
jgi:hypothetical protein